MTPPCESGPNLVKIESWAKSKPSQQTETAKKVCLSLLSVKCYDENVKYFLRIGCKAVTHERQREKLRLTVLTFFNRLTGLEQFL
jgi:hypothetical protein